MDPMRHASWVSLCVGWAQKKPSGSSGKRCIDLSVRSLAPPLYLHLLCNFLSARGARSLEQLPEQPHSGSMVKQLKIDFVSDVSCPWCAIGLAALQQALERIGDEVKADIHFQPFELNPDMPKE